MPRKGIAYHDKSKQWYKQQGKNRVKEADSHHNGWLSGLKKSLKLVIISKSHYEYAVDAYIRGTRDEMGNRTRKELGIE